VLTCKGTQQTWSSVLTVVVVVTVVGDVGRDERCGSGGGGGGVCCTTVVLVCRKQHKRFSRRRELFGFRVTTAENRNTHTTTLCISFYSTETLYPRKL